MKTKKVRIKYHSDKSTKEVFQVVNKNFPYYPGICVCWLLKCIGSKSFFHILNKYSFAFLKKKKKDERIGPYRLKENIMYGPGLDSASNEPTIVKHVWDN